MTDFDPRRDRAPLLGTMVIVALLAFATGFVGYVVGAVMRGGY